MGLRCCVIGSEQIWPKDTAVGEHPPIPPLFPFRSRAPEPTVDPGTNDSPFEFLPVAPMELDRQPRLSSRGLRFPPMAAWHPRVVAALRGLRLPTLPGHRFRH